MLSSHEVRNKATVAISVPLLAAKKSIILSDEFFNLGFVAFLMRLTPRGRFRDGPGSQGLANHGLNSRDSL